MLCQRVLLPGQDDLKVPAWRSLAAAMLELLNRPVSYAPHLDGNSSEKVSLLAAISAIQTQLRETDGETSVYVADNGVYSEANMRQLNLAGVQWISRVSETLAEAKALLEEGSENWQQSQNGTTRWFSRQITLPQGRERWVVVSSQASVERVRQTMQRQVSKAHLLAQEAPPFRDSRLRY